jgi:hypothetical protein
MSAALAASNEISASLASRIRDRAVGVVAGAGWAAFLFADNITNKHALFNAIDSLALDVPTMTRDTTNQPKTIGLSLSNEF